MQSLRLHPLICQVLICLCLVSLMVPVDHFMVTSSGVCRPGEWQCGGSATEHKDGHVQCITENKFCDGIENCDDASDEPVGCTNCNRSFIGEANAKFPVRVTGPFQRYLPFICHISFVAAGKEYGDFVELTFLSFQIGTLEFTRNQTPVCQKGHLKITEQSSSGDLSSESEERRSPFYSSVGPLLGFSPATKDSIKEEAAIPQFGQFCGSLVERSVTYFSESSNVTVTAVVPGRASNPSSSFSLYLTYRFLSRKFQLPQKMAGEAYPYLGTAAPGTYCDRVFNDCSSQHRRCTIRSPNFPGFYPRNITCRYIIRQQHVPQDHTSRLILSQPNDYKISIPTGRTSTTTGNAFLLSTDCVSGDSVRIYDGTSVRSPILLEFCGSGSLPDVISSKGEVLVVLHSASYQHLRSSRLEIDIETKFKKIDIEPSSSQGHNSGNARCSQTFYGANQRNGVVKSPSYSMPRDANCTFRFIGASIFDKVWIYFVSFYSLIEKRPTDSGTEQQSCSSILELSDSQANITSAVSYPNIGQSTLSFCGDVIPKMCTHAADYPAHYIPPRPCDIKTESYISTGSEFIIRHRFLAPATEVVTTRTSSFIARYEFVDTSESGVAIEHTECDRRFDSRVSKSGSLTNSRNIFLYGRGGKSNLSCMYHFVGLPYERVRITLRKLHLITGNSSCKMSYDSVMQKHACKWLRSPSSKSVQSAGHVGEVFSSISAVEYWDGYSSVLGCLCNASVDTRQPPVIFESLVSNMKLNFLINQMNSLQDFNDYNFYAEYEFFNSSTCEKGLKHQKISTGEGELVFQIPLESARPLPEQGYQAQPLRCRWLIEASVHKYLYLKVKGVNISSNDRCQMGNRVLIYLDPRSKPVANACVEERRSTTNHYLEEFDIFSHTWYNESHGSGDDRDRLFVEFIINSNQVRTSFELHWLEVTKPYVKTQSGQTLRNVNCLFECPEISACIDPDLWCDSIVHCPSGYDESLEHCRTFPTAYVSTSVVALVILIALISWIIVKRTRIRNRVRKKNVRRLPRDNCLNMESPVG